MILPITLTIAGAAAILNIWLAGRVSSLRRKGKVSIGDGGNSQVLARMRAHANFAEYTPIVLILTGLIELARGTHIWLWAVGILYIAGRISHAFGMDRPGANVFRVAGILITFIVTLGLAAYALTLPYMLHEGAITTVVAH